MPFIVFFAILTSPDKVNNKSQLLFFIPVLLVYGIGMFLEVMEVDAAQYAYLSMEMLNTGNYLEIYDHGFNYLDKPPLLFWLSAFSFKTFGISNFSYRLPSVLFSLLGLFSTYKLGKALVNERVGFYAALMLSSCQACFMMNHDVRTDTILTACTIFSIWQLYLFTENNRLLHLFLGAMGIAGAMLTKGPIGIMVPALAIGFHLVVKRRWGTILNWRWLFVPFIVLILISPMLIGLYRQYDLHPGKLIQGVPIQSGLRFFFWTQSFGRITGESVWKDNTTSLFFTHTFLWAFLPWCVIFLIGLSRDTFQLIRAKFKLLNHGEALAWGGFVFPFIVFSTSHYKLPHYIFIICPLAAIIAGKFLHNLFQEEMTTKLFSILKWSQLVIALLIYTLIFTLCIFSFPMRPVLFWSLLFLGMGISIFFARNGKSPFQKIILPSFIAIVVLNFILNSHFYPALFSYAASNRAGEIMHASEKEVKNLVEYNELTYGLDFYSRTSVKSYYDLSDLISKSQSTTLWIFTNQKGYEEIKESNLMILDEKKFEHFHISKLSVRFLNPKTRHEKVDFKYLVHVHLKNYFSLHN